MLHLCMYLLSSCHINKVSEGAVILHARDISPGALCSPRSYSSLVSHCLLAVGKNLQGHLGSPQTALRNQHHPNHSSSVLPNCHASVHLYNATSCVFEIGSVPAIHEIRHHAIKQEFPAFPLRHYPSILVVPTLQAVEAIDSERDVLQAELDSKAEQVANLTEELELGHQQADDANRQAHTYQMNVPVLRRDCHPSYLLVRALSAVLSTT